MSAETAGNPDTQPSPKTGHLKTVDSSAKAPFFRAVDKTKAGWTKFDQIREETGRKALIATGKLDAGMQKILRFNDPEEPNVEPLLFPPKTPLYATGDMADAALLTPARRIWEMTNATASATRAAYRTITRPIPLFHFKDTLFHPMKYLTNSGRLVTSTAKLGTHILNAPTRGLDEIINRGIKRPLKRLGAKIPLLGKPIVIIGGAAGWLAKQPRKLTEFLTKPVEIADQWMAKKQNG